MRVELRRQLWESAPARRAGSRPALSAREVARELERSRQADRDYWREIVAELEALDRQSRLLAEGTGEGEWLAGRKE
jgi:hypothetical protein